PTAGLAALHPLTIAGRREMQWGLFFGDRHPRRNRFPERVAPARDCVRLKTPLGQLHSARGSSILHIGRSPSVASLATEQPGSDRRPYRYSRRDRGAVANGAPPRNSVCDDCRYGYAPKQRKAGVLHSDTPDLWHIATIWICDTGRLLQLPRPRRQRICLPPFAGLRDEDIEDWIDSFERVSNYNRWDDNIKLENVAFYLVDNHEDEIPNWTSFTPKIREIFGTPTSRKENAKKKLQHRQQQNEETYTSYIEDVDKNPPTTSELRQMIREIVREEMKKLNPETPATKDHGDLSTDLRALVQEELAYAASTARPRAASATMSPFTYNGSTHSRTHKRHDVPTLETDQFYTRVLLLRQ
ncbi:hypothetical protein HPB47_020861, partial [Ixodes persulcatus]